MSISRVPGGTSVFGLCSASLGIGHLCIDRTTKPVKQVFFCNFGRSPGRRRQMKGQDRSLAPNWSDYFLLCPTLATSAGSRSHRSTFGLTFDPSRSTLLSYVYPKR